MKKGETMPATHRIPARIAVIVAVMLAETVVYVCGYIHGSGARLDITRSPAIIRPVEPELHGLPEVIHKTT